MTFRKTAAYRAAVSILAVLALFAFAACSDSSDDESSTSASVVYSAEFDTTDSTVTNAPYTLTLTFNTDYTWVLSYSSENGTAYDVYSGVWSGTMTGGYGDIQMRLTRYDTTGATVTSKITSAYLYGIMDIPYWSLMDVDSNSSSDLLLINAINTYSGYELVLH